MEQVLVHLNGSSQHSFEGIRFEYGTWLRPMEGDGFVEGQSAACAVCPAGELKAHHINNGHPASPTSWVNNGPFPVGYVRCLESVPYCMTILVAM